MAIADGAALGEEFVATSDDGRSSEAGSGLIGEEEDGQEEHPYGKLHLFCSGKANTNTAEPLGNCSVSGQNCCIRPATAEPHPDGVAMY